MEFVGYIDALSGCVLGCDEPDPLSPDYDWIDAAPLPPQPFVDYGDANANLAGNGTSYNYAYSNNNAIGWYLGDIDPEPDGENRVIRLVYQVKAPTIEDTYDVIIGQRSGTAWDAHDDIISNRTYFERASQVNYPNQVTLRSDASDRAYWDSASPDINGHWPDPNWWNNTDTAILWDTK